MSQWFYPDYINREKQRYYVFRNKFIIKPCIINNSTRYQKLFDVPQELAVFSKRLPVIGIYYISSDSPCILVLNNYHFKFFFQGHFKYLFTTMYHKGIKQITRYKSINAELYLDRNIRRVFLTTRTKCVEAHKDSKYSHTDSKGQFIQFFPLEVSLYPVKKRKLLIRETTFSIGAYSFCYNHSVSSIRFPASLTVIESHAFSCCFNLSKVSFPLKSRLRLIGSSAFKKCYGLRKIIFPATLNSIKKEAFAKCKNLEKAWFHSHMSLNEMGSKAFSHTSLRAVIVMPNVKYERDVYEECWKMREIIFVDPITTINNLFRFTSILKVTIPASATTISHHAFSYNTNLRVVVFNLQSKLKTIEKNAFAHTLINNISIPDSVETIEYHAFKECRNLERVSFGRDSRLTKLGNDVFKSTPLKEITIPSSTEIVGWHYSIKTQQNDSKTLKFNYRIIPRNKGWEEFMRKEHYYVD